MGKNVSAELSPLEQEFRRRKENSRGGMLLIRQSPDYYWLLFEDAEEAAPILGMDVERFGSHVTPRIRFYHTKLDTYLPMIIRAGKRPIIQEKITINNNQNSEDKTMKPETLNINESGNVQNNAQVNNIKTSADVAEVDDIMPVVTPKASGLTPDPSPKGEGSKPETRNLKPETKVKTNLKPVNLKPETKQAAPASLPTLTLAVYTTKRGEQAPRIDGFGGEEDPRWKKHYDEKIRLSNKREKAKRKNNKLHQEMKGKSAAEKEELLKKIIHVPSDPFGANYFIDHITGEKKYYFIMGAKYMGVAQQLVDAYNSGDEQVIALAEQAVIDCKSGIVAEIEASRNSNGDEPDTCNVKPETKVYTAAEVADLIQRIANNDPKALAEYDALTKKAA